MPTRALTVASVARIRPPARGQADYFDKGYPGLALRVSYGGAKTWALFYRLHGGKLRRMTLGRWPAMELADARAAWREAREAAAKGETPSRRRPVAADTFAAVAADWLRRDQAHNRSSGEVKRVIARDVNPRWEDRLFASITRRDVRDLIDGIADRGAVTYARRVQAHLHRLFRWGVGRDLVPSNPCTDLPKPGAVVKRDRVLTDGELALVWAAAGATEWPFGAIFQLLILTAARREEIGALTRSEIHRDAIELAGERTKNGERHVIPLSTTAIAVIKTLPHIAESELVFSTTGRTPVSGWSKAKALLDQEVARRNHGRALPAWRIHDLRRTVATGMQALGITVPVVEEVLGHIAGSRAGVAAIYQRHTYDAEKRTALEAWAQHVVAIAGGESATVIPLNVRARA